MKEHTPQQIKELAWSGKTLLKKAPDSEKLYYTCMQMVSEIYRLTKDGGKCKQFSNDSLRYYRQFQLLERISDENLRRYRFLYGEVLGKVNTQCPTCKAMLDILSGLPLQDYWKERLSKQDED